MSMVTKIAVTTIRTLVTLISILTMMTVLMMTVLTKVVVNVRGSSCKVFLTFAQV
jgi:hypothetical protein